MRVLLVPLALVLPSLCLAQSTCFTDPHGTTICSSPGTVVHGNTDSTGHSLYRDDRGNRLDFETDRSGKAAVNTSFGRVHQLVPAGVGRKKVSLQPRPAAGAGSVASCAR